MSRGRKSMMLVQACVTLVAGAPLVPETIPPGGKVYLPKEEAERLIAEGHAVEAPQEDIPANPPPPPSPPSGEGGGGGQSDESQ